MRRTRRGFTLVEILIVVLLLAILAAIVLPQFLDAPRQARESNLLDNLSKFRMLVELYRHQHARLPTGDEFASQMTKPTNFEGEVGEQRGGEFKYGPYIEQMPPNPFTGLRTIRSTTTAADLFPPGDADGGWWYNETTGRFYADLSDARVNSRGEPYNRY
jgi:prepilin-type N-terminal cleavage/methylation domain-containing protein